ncbi:EAL domain-containing protein [Halopseudomonas nanhaiensis]|uniref:bifunctional diguanylate cyclase/phosphodiesterase n=1 Tax=Halopseudomonas nanhaiensis TaxID=2830842 RepID=UPI001CBC3A0E|nr:EAL domain-containing protein [Halopseudomonas nanhaiensis]UAW98703.1 EAL domain-containing protein [Halopseudomonas nanhaiensis]
MQPEPSSLSPIRRRHASHRDRLRSVSRVLAAMAAVFLVARFVALPEGLRATAASLAGSPAVHMVFETIAIIMASMVFAIGWSSHRRQSSRSLLVLSCLFLGVAVLDFSHMLSFSGMPTFFTPAGTDKAIQFWLAARALAAIAMLWVALTPWRVAHIGARRFSVLLAVLLPVALFHLLALRFPELLPSMHVPGIGLTPGKIRFEYALAVANCIAMLALWQAMRRPLPFNGAALFGAAGAMALTQLCFTSYETSSHHLVALGHLFKIVAYGFLVRAIFVESIEQPYEMIERSQKRLQAIFDALPDVVMEIDHEGRVTEFHAPGNELMALSSSPLKGRLIGPLLPPEAIPLCQRTFALAKVQGHAQSEPFRFVIKGHTFWFQISAAPKHTDGDDSFVVVARDVTKSKQQESEILRLAQFDSLTGLPNRKLFHQRVDLALGISERNAAPVALMSIDLDHFKNINDTLGHQAGDEMLIAIAERLRGQLREEDTLSRPGGDEFVLALPGLDGVAAAHVAERLLQTIVRPVNVVDRVVSPSASIGIAIYPEDGLDFDELTRRADAAMHLAKQQGRNTYRFFTGEIQTRMSRILSLESALRTAIDNLELALEYQPQWDMENHTIVGMEALLRWNHPELGELGPAEFIPIAEASGQMLALGDWVLNQTLAQLRHWIDDGVEPPPIAINLSMMQFRRGDLVKHIRNSLRTWQVAPGYLQLELTEGIAMEDPTAAASQLQQLSTLGVRIAIGDFGTGYSSLAYLKRFRASVIKIDRSFIEGLEQDPENQIIVSSMITLAHNLGLQAMAEGVETESQLRTLRAQGCRYMQGFYWSHPLDADTMTRLLWDMRRPNTAAPDQIEADE